MASPSRRARARTYAILTGATGLTAILAALAGLWLCAPIALAFAGFAYAWYHRVAYVPDPSACTGCAAGCVGCRERIDSPTSGSRWH